MLQWHRVLNGFELQQFLQGVRVGESMGIIAWLVEGDQCAAVLRGPCIDLAAAALGELHQAFEQGHLEQAKHRLSPDLAIAFGCGGHGQIGILFVHGLCKPFQQVERKQGRVARHSQQQRRFAALQSREKAC